MSVKVKIVKYSVDVAHYDVADFQRVIALRLESGGAQRSRYLIELKNKRHARTTDSMLPGLQKS